MQGCVVVDHVAGGDEMWLEYVWGGSFGGIGVE